MIHEDMHQPIRRDSLRAVPGAGAQSLSVRLAPDLLARVGRWAVWAALIEFLLLRIVIRLGPMLPSSQVVTAAAQVVLFVGTVALNAAVFLTTLAVLIIAGLTRSNALRSLLVVVAVLNVIRAVSPPGVTPMLDVIFLLHSVVMLAAMVVAAILVVAHPASAGRPQGGQPQGLPLLRCVMLMLLVALYVALAGPTVAASAARLGWQWFNKAMVVPHFLAEALAVLVALMVYFVYRPAPSRRALVVALIATVLLGGLWIARPHLASAFAQWTVDFATWLPPWLYLLGLACFLYTAIALARSSEARSRFAAWGLILIALGGLRWDYTYFSGLGLLGFLLLAEPWE